MAKDSRQKALHWVFTVNNYTEKEINDLFYNDKTHYICFGGEVGENGTPHLQGYLAFKNKQALSACKKLNSRAHWEVKRGTVQQAIDYCKKGKFISILSRSS